MSPASKQFVEILDFPGLVTNADGADVPAGCADVQLNLMSHRTGMLQARPGVTEVVFEE